MKTPYDVIYEPILTEKGMMQQEELNKYHFRVAKNSNKIQIKKAVEEIFDVTVTKVATMNIRGKKKRERYVEGYTPDWKKAIVTLAEGDYIDFFE
ncbi:MAG: 50S ribosomal protein L23 [Candidatus Mcinerneyibacterium aminivorans]|uniref:Large ribosomal subunit protein uL23 n=1 Tax=Candidatus Mcinerneyibacterium aminivorans TaxID=2703815 RepID=A0A5D0MIT9_9BACT|nr:MAG: 50S ribosomal protein L23 [Candidatus Mcinerneyibacterium aminivorans]